MLGAYFNFKVVNNTDQTFTYDNAARIQFFYRPWKMTNGAMAIGSEVSATPFLSPGESVAAAGSVNCTAIDNTSDLNIGFTGTLYGKADQNSTDGTLDLYIQQSTDNSRWPTDGTDSAIAHLKQIGSLEFSTDAEDEDASVNVNF